MNKFVYSIFTLLLFFTFTHSIDAQIIGKGSTAYHTYFVNSSNQTFCWGRNSNGQLGNGTQTNSLVPIPLAMTGVLSGKTFTKIGVAYRHTMALTSDGLLFAWGENSYGSLGNNTFVTSLVPTPVDMTGALSGKTITELSLGRYHAMVLSSDGLVFTWGDNDLGQLGTNNMALSDPTPTVVDTSGVLSGKTITAISGSRNVSMALSSEGMVYTWGFNGYGQLGNNDTLDSHVPVLIDTSGVLSGKTITAISTGSYHSIALSADNKLYAWGRNNNGQLGNNSTVDSSVPVEVVMTGVLTGKTVSTISAGRYHNMIQTSDGIVYAWGFNDYGHLGINSTTDSHEPIAIDTTGVLSGKTITDYLASRTHSIALDSEGGLYIWGLNTYGQLGDNTNTTRLGPIIVDPAALPVELSSFTATALSGNVILNWETTTEVNNYGFEIERASSHQNGTTPVQGESDVILSGDEGWKNIGFVKGNGNSNSVINYSFTDLENNSSKSFYRLKQIDNDGSFEYSNIVEVNSTTPVDYKLEQNYPNPFNPSTTINYTIAQEGNVRLSIFNVLGEEVTVLVNEKLQAGNYSTKFDASSFNRQITSGIYFYRIDANNFVQTKKMMLVK